MSTVDETKFFRARITQRKNFSSDLWMVNINPGGEFRFTSGQYATLGVEKDGKRVERPYSIVSSPAEPELEFFLELVPHGELTPLLHQLNPGDELLMRKSAKGRFVLDMQSGHKNHYLVATVTGVAPYVSFVRTLAREAKEGRFSGEHKLYILFGASRSEEFCYHEELKKMAAELSWLKYVPTISRPWEDPEWKGETGRVDDLLRKYSDMWGLEGTNCTAYLCGNPDMIEHGKGILKRRGFAKESLKEEVYWIPEKEPAK